jgi:hypothetical protein
VTPPLPDKIDDDPLRRLRNGRHIPPLPIHPVLLQPTFLKLASPHQPPSNESSNSSLGVGQSLEIDANDIWNMWSIATKAKSSIPQGYRLENLSWRLWHRLAANAPHHHHHNTSVGDGKEDRPLKDNNTSQRFLDSPSFNCPALLETCCTILAEIQGATLCCNNPQFQSTSDPTPSPTDSISNPRKSSNIAAPTMGKLRVNHRRKKNVQRFIQRYQSNLEGMGEQEDDSGQDEQQMPPQQTAPIPVVVAAKRSPSASDGEGQEKRKPQSNETYFNEVPPTNSRPSPTPSDGKVARRVSLLTKLLDHPNVNPPPSNATLLMRPDSCPPPPASLSQTPPVRPGAPVPSEVLLEGKTPTSRLIEEEKRQRRLSLSSQEDDYMSTMLW